MTPRGQRVWEGLLIAALYLFLLGPLLVIVPVSFSGDAYLAFPPTQWSLRWYRALLDNEPFVRGFRVSLVVGLAVAALAVLLGLPAALAIGRYRFPGRGALTSFFLMPLMVPGIVLGLAMLLVLAPLQLTASYPSLVAAHLVVTLPYVVRTTATALLTLNPLYEEAALSLGATPWRTFLRVTLPLVRPGLAAGAAIAFLVSFDEVVITLFLVGPRLTTLPVEMLHYVEYRTDPVVAALSVILITISVGGVVTIERVLGLRRVLA